MRRITLFLTITIGLSAAATSPARACACCLTIGGVHYRSNVPFGTFLDQHHRAIALEAMTLQGQLEWQPKAGSPDDEPESTDITLRYADGVFTLTNRQSGEGVLVFEPDDSVEVFWSDVTAPFTNAYVEWTLTGHASTSDERFSALVDAATLVIQGQQNACWDPRNMKRWILILDAPHSDSNLSAFGDIVIDAAAWEKAEYSDMNRR